MGEFTTFEHHRPPLERHSQTTNRFCSCCAPIAYASPHNLLTLRAYYHYPQADLLSGNYSLLSQLRSVGWFFVSERRASIFRMKLLLTFLNFPLSALLLGAAEGFVHLLIVITPVVSMPSVGEHFARSLALFEAVFYSELTIKPNRPGKRSFQRRRWGM